MLCFNRLTGEYDTKKIFLKNFVLWEYIFNIKLFVASVHNLRVLLIFFDFMLFVS